MWKYGVCVCHFLSYLHVAFIFAQWIFKLLIIAHSFRTLMLRSNEAPIIQSNWKHYYSNRQSFGAFFLSSSFWLFKCMFEFKNISIISKMWTHFMCLQFLTLGNVGHDPRKTVVQVTKKQSRCSFFFVVVAMTQKLCANVKMHDASQSDIRFIWWITKICAAHCMYIYIHEIRHTQRISARIIDKTNSKTWMYAIAFSNMLCHFHNENVLYCL